MQVKVTITPTKTTSASLYLSGAYKAKNGVIRVLTDNDEVVEWTGNFKDMPRAKGIWFDKSLPRLVIEYEDDEKTSKANGTWLSDNKNKRKAEVFYANHVEFSVNGKRHANSIELPSFNMNISTDIVAAEHALFRDTLLVKNRVNSMTYEEKCSAADYYGISPKNKTELDLLIELAGDKGICMTENNMKIFLREWMTPNEDTLLVVNIRKAIRLKVIEERNTAGRIDYYIGTTFIGTTIEDIIAYCRNNEQIYSEHILRKSEEDMTREVEATEKLESQIAGTSEEMSVSALQDLRNEAVELKKDGFITKHYNVKVMYALKLLPLVEAARKEKEKKESKVLV